MSKPSPLKSPNRDLDAGQVVTLFAESLPHLMHGLGQDRAWLWWSGDKPADQDRAVLLELGFRFTPRPHTRDDGKTAHWYHACGGAVLHRRRGASASVPTGPVSRDAVPASAFSPDVDASLAALAHLLP
jgi:hypothetical protein